MSTVDTFCFSPNLLNHHVIFLIGNVIIVVCFLLSRRSNEGNRSEKYNEKHNSSFQHGTIEDDFIVELVTSKDEKPNKEGCYENVVVKATESETAMEVTIKQAVKKIEWFRRTQSEKLKREMSIEPRQELRRVSRSRLLVTTGDERSSEMVEMMSNEEFQLVVETFILKQQRFLMQECMVESGSKL
ncbi:hypothetical protein QVD17_39098 [Tagetes erecta]|uniref:DUF4408 domain-containing protein n=1 Tax=Tagetes erecta TaxID=13708 RepID=A0AAD8JMZ2_TARER|nr:hypothetical protein QVD17_39098 [Tagetes erecta]